MATCVGEKEGISMRESCSGDDVTVMESSPGVQESNIRRVRHTSRRRKWRHRSIGSRSLLLILAWVFIICCSLNLTLKTMKQYKSNLSPEKEGNSSLSVVGGAQICPSHFQCYCHHNSNSKSSSRSRHWSI
jgi:hypothetical protein